MGNNEKRYNMIDILRVVAAVLVVTIHTSALRSFNEDAWLITSSGLARIAVPFFFILTGYFFYEKIKNNKSTKGYIQRLGKFYSTWVVIEVVLLIPLVYSNVMKDPNSIIIILLVGVTGSLWYISSTILALVLITPILKRRKFMILFIISIVLYIIGLSGDSYFKLAEGNIFGTLAGAYTSIFVYANIGVTCSIPFIVIGAIVNHYDLKSKIKSSGTIAIVGIVILIIETFILYKNGISKDYNMYISLLIVTPAIFIWSLNSKIKVSDKVTNLCREYSIGLYCTHQTFMLYCFVIFGNYMQNTIFRFASTFVIASIVTFVLMKFKLTRKYLLLSN